MEQIAKKPMITKDEFNVIMEKLVSHFEFVDDLYSLYSKYQIDGDPYVSPIFDISVEMLEKLMGVNQDSDGYSTISWWFYENNCGKEDKNIFFYGKKVNLNTIEDVWNQCIRELEDEGNE